METNNPRTVLEVLLTVWDGKHPPAIEKLAAQRVEVIDMVFVTEKNGIDGGQLMQFGGRAVDASQSASRGFAGEAPFV